MWYDSCLRCQKHLAVLKFEEQVSSEAEELLLLKLPLRTSARGNSILGQKVSQGPTYLSLASISLLIISVVENLKHRQKFDCLHQDW